MKVLRRSDEPGKGAFWTIDPSQIKSFDGLNFRKKVVKATFIGPMNDPSLPVVPKEPKEVKPTIAKVPAKPPAPAKPLKLSIAAKTVVKPKPPLPRPAPGPTLTAPLPIIVAPIPASYVRPAPAPSSSSAPPDELTAALLRDPPIVLHEGKLILNPTIFRHLTQEQLDNLQVLPASQALQILQAFVVQHFKDKMKQTQLAKQAAAKTNGGETSTTVAAAVEPIVAVVDPTIDPSLGPSTAPRSIAAKPGPKAATPVVNEKSKVIATPVPKVTAAMKRKLAETELESDEEVDEVREEVAGAEVEAVVVEEVSEDSGDIVVAGPSSTVKPVEKKVEVKGKAKKVAKITK